MQSCSWGGARGRAAICAVVFVLGSLACSAARAQTQNYVFDVRAPEGLKELIEHQTLIGRWSGRPEYRPDQFEALYERLPDEIRILCRTLGYFSCDVKTHAEAGRVSAEVDLGRRSQVGHLELLITQPPAADGESSASHLEFVQRLRSQWPLPQGAPYDASTWESGKRTLVEQLRQHGYLRARLVDSKAVADVAAARVDLRVEVDTGERMFFGPVRIKGLSRYPRSVIDGLTRFGPGDPYSYDEMLRFQSRLRDSGYFSSVYVTADEAGLDADAASPRAVPIQVEVVELKAMRSIYGLGYSSDNGARLTLGFEHRNLFGLGHKLESGTILEERRRRVFVNVRTPSDLDGHYWAYGARYDRQNIQGLRTGTSTLYGGRGKVSENIESFTSVQFQNESYVIDPGNGDSPIGQHNRALTLGYSWNWRNLDSRLDPRQGSTLSTQISGAARGALTYTSFARFYGRALHFFPMNRETPSQGGVLIAMLELGYVLADTPVGIPSENLFRTGGTQSVRGYSYLSLGPRIGTATVGGRVLGVASLEYQHPLTRQFWLATFVDAGNAADRLADYKPVYGYGVGLRWRTPVGPVNLDLAYGQADHRFRVQFSVGYLF